MASPTIRKPQLTPDLLGAARIPTRGLFPPLYDQIRGQLQHRAGAAQDAVQIIRARDCSSGSKRRDVLEQGLGVIGPVLPCRMESLSRRQACRVTCSGMKAVIVLAQRRLLSQCRGDPAPGGGGR
jgi:hypothetical protein